MRIWMLTHAFQPRGYDTIRVWYVSNIGTLSNSSCRSLFSRALLMTITPSDSLGTSLTSSIVVTLLMIAPLSLDPIPHHASPMFLCPGGKGAEQPGNRAMLHRRSAPTRFERTHSATALICVDLESILLRLECSHTWELFSHLQYCVI